MKTGKRILSVLLVVGLLLSIAPFTEFSIEAEAVMTLTQLRQKFPHGKYWNHANNPGASNSVNNQNGYTSTPCTKHGGYIGTSSQTCNGFSPSGTQLSWQCMGYAEKLGYDATGYNPRNNSNGWHTYTSSSALNNLKPGDIVRYKNGGHSIYVTGVNGETVTYTDCNSDGHCIIRWDATISKSTLRSTFTHVRSAPSALPPEPEPCSCSTSYAGTYICTTSNSNLTIRSGHGISYSAIGSIPPGASVTVTKASGTSNSDWAHVTYNGISGYASMQYLTKKQAAQVRDSKMYVWFSNAEMGDSIGTIRTGEWVYLCYKLYDANTGDLFDTYNRDGYIAKLTIYGPDGSVAHTGTYSDDNSWISIKRTTPGKYKGELVFTWDSGGSSVASASLDMIYEPRVTPSASDVQLNVVGVNSQTINISYSGATNSNSIYLDCSVSGDCFSYSWGSWTDHKMPLTITGIRAGQGTVTIKLHDSDTDEILATSIVHVTVTAPTYTVTYNANGGSGAPGNQTKYYNTTLTLSSTKPTRSGHTFLGWSSSSSATSASYSAGSSYSSNADLTLYAVWKKNLTYTLSYNANGGSGAPSSQTGASSYTISSTEPIKSGYTFLGWSTISSASSAIYKPGQTISVSSNTTLYAVWKKTFYGDVNNDGIVNAADVTTMNKLVKGTGVNSLNTLKGDLNGDGKLTDGDLSLLVSFYRKEIDTFPVESIFSEFCIYDMPTKTRYKLGEKITADGLSVMVYYTNGYYHIVDSGFTISPVTALKPGSQEATVSLGDWSDTFDIYVDDTSSYTLTYNANGGSGAPSSTSGATSYTISSTVPTRQGYTFLGWSTSSSASSATYKPGQTINLSSNTTLYAVWKTASAIYTSTSYSTNIEFANQEYYYTFTPSTSCDYMFESTGSLDTRVYVYDSSWNEIGYDDDSGADNNFKMKVMLTSGTKYYVKVRAYSSKVGSTSFKITREAYTLTYNANGGSGAPTSQSGATSYTISSTVPTRQGYTFLGWSTSSSVSSATYKPGQTINLNANTTLYAVWKSAVNIVEDEEVDVKFDFANQNQYYTFTPTSSGEYTFISISAHFDTKMYVYNSSWTQIGFKNGSDYSCELNVNLTAGNKYYVKLSGTNISTGYGVFGVIKYVPDTYTLSYNANGGSGAPSSVSGATSYTISSTVPTRQGYTFLGWSTSSSASSATYKPGQTINLNANTTLYAVWKEKHEHTYTSVTTNPDCVNQGSIKYTCACGDSYSESIPATGHVFDDDDENCQVCGFDRTDDCDCNCHKGGIANFFFKIILFFQRIFGINEECDCGIEHY